MFALASPAYTSAPLRLCKPNQHAAVATEQRRDAFVRAECALDPPPSYGGLAALDLSSVFGDGT
jgi:hypothetical protein